MIREVHLNSQGFIVGFFGIALMWVYLFGNDITAVLLNESWAKISTILLLLCASKLFEGLTGIEIAIYNALGFPNIAFYNHALKGLVLVGLCISLLLY